MEEEIFGCGKGLEGKKEYALLERATNPENWDLKDLGKVPIKELSWDSLIDWAKKHGYANKREDDSYYFCSLECSKDGCPFSIQRGSVYHENSFRGGGYALYENWYGGKEIEKIKALSEIVEPQKYNKMLKEDYDNMAPTYNQQLTEAEEEFIEQIKEYGNSLK